LFKSFTIADYYFVKSLVFARSTLHEDEFNLYRQLFQIIYQQLPFPNLYVYLHANPDRLLRNIAARGRDYEKNISLEYLLQIQKSYFEYFKSENRFPILVVETSDIDFVNNNQDYSHLIEVIFSKNYQKGLHKVII